MNKKSNSREKIRVDFKHKIYYYVDIFLKFLTKIFQNFIIEIDTIKYSMIIYLNNDNTKRTSLIVIFSTKFCLQKKGGDNQIK